MTFVLIFVGGLVKSHEAGLSVPDWPTSFGYNMFTLPLSMWMDNSAFYEHGHRLYASVVGFLILLQAFFIHFKEDRKWVKQLGWTALLLVTVQGILGGLTVKFYLPTAISSSHAGLAQVLFCLTLAIALVTSRRWIDSSPKHNEPSAWGLRRLSVIAVGMIFLQIILGAIMRHEEAGLAIRDFPLSNGGIVPEFTSFAVTIHFLHRLGAVLTSIIVIWTASVAIKHYGDKFKRLAWVSVIMLLVQSTLGAITVLSEKAITPTTLHVSGGAALLGTMVLLAIRVRHEYAPASATRSAASELTTISANA